MSYVNVDTAIKGKLEVKTRTYELASKVFFFSSSVFTFVLYVVTLDQVEMAFFMESKCIIPVVAVPKYSFCAYWWDLGKKEPQLSIS